MTYIIRGKNQAFGEVEVSGAKNFSIKALAATLLCEDTVTLHNIPNNLDIKKTASMIISAGGEVEINSKNFTCKANSESISGIVSDSSSANMSTFLIGAALIHKHDTIKFPKPNGCPLGARKLDFHIEAFKKFGAECHELNGYFVINKQDSLKGCEVELNYPSVGATETALFLGVKAKGTTIIKNAAIEPEIKALITALVSMGAKIHFTNDRTIKIEGVEKLEGKDIFIHPDLIETATWATLAAVTNGEITVHNTIPEMIGSFLGVFTALGGGFERISPTSMKFFRKEKINKPVFVETGTFPQLRTDLQPLIATLAATNNSHTIIHETVYNDRLEYISDFKDFGIKIEGLSECLGSECRFSNKGIHSAIISGPNEIRSPKNPIEAKTIRSGMSAIILAAKSEGITIITNTEVIERGYCNLFEKLKKLSIKIEKQELKKLSN